MGRARLRFLVKPTMTLPETGDRQADVMTLTQKVNDRLECWIRQYPESWLWLHRRWPKDVTAKLSTR